MIFCPVKSSSLTYHILLVSHTQVEMSLQRGHVKQFSYIHATNMIRPQLKWVDKIDNSPAPFRPIIKHKPNALRPLPTGDEQHKHLQVTVLLEGFHYQNVDCIATYLSA